MMQPKLTIKIIVLGLLLCFLFATPGFSEILVYDANDQYLGILINSDSYGSKIDILVPSITTFVTLSIEGDQENGLIGNIYDGGHFLGDQSIYFESCDCTGLPYDIGRFTYAKEYGMNFIRTDYNNPKTIMPKSKEYFNNNSMSIVCEEIHNASLKVFYPMILLTLPFNTPITPPLRYEKTFNGDVSGDGKIGLEEAVNALQITSGLKNPGPPTGGTK